MDIKRVAAMSVCQSIKCSDCPVVQPENKGIFGDQYRLCFLSVKDENLEKFLYLSLQEDSEKTIAKAVKSGMFELLSEDVATDALHILLSYAQIDIAE